MVLVVHDYSNRTIRFEINNKIFWRGFVSEFTDDIAIKILSICKLDTTNIWNIKLWKLYELYNMFIDHNDGKISFDNGIIIDEKNKIKYILVLDIESIIIDNNYSCILLLYAPYELSKTLENRLIKSDLTIHFIRT